MTKIMFIGDPHIRHTHLAEGENLLKWVEQLAEEHKPDLIVNLGDTLDDHAVIRAEALSLVNSHVRRVVGMGFPLVMVLGNHDMWKPNCNKYHALEVFKGVKGVAVVDRATTIAGITYVPYLSSPKDWPDIKTSVVVTHNTFVGADYGFKCAEDGIDLDVVQGYTVISGHIHKRQALKAGSVIYPGTPTSLSASDANQEKGIMFLDSRTLETTFVKSPFPVWRSIEVGIQDVEGISLNPTDRWIVKLIGPRAEIKAWLDSKHAVSLRKISQVSFKTEFTDSAKSTRAQISAPTVYSMAEQYVDRVYAGALDKSVLKGIIKKYAGQQ